MKFEKADAITILNAGKMKLEEIQSSESFPEFIGQEPPIIEQPPLLVATYNPTIHFVKADSISELESRAYAK